MLSWRKLSLSSLAGAAAVLLGGALLAQPAASDRDASAADSGQQSDGLSDELLKDLLPPASAQPVPPAASQPAGEDLGAVAPSGPLQVVREQMNAVAARMSQQQVDDQTVQLQQQIVTALDRLLDEATPPSPQPTPQSDQRSQSQGAESQQQAEQRAGNEGEAGEGVEDDPLARDALREIWGQLPDRLRDDIHSPLREEFLPAYRELIIEYYRQLGRRRDG